MADRLEPGQPDLPEAVAVPRRRFTPQLIWIVPIVAVLVGGWLAVKAVLERGPVITITFKTAEGLEAGKTKIKYKEVEIGLVKTVTLSPDRKGVVATAELSIVLAVRSELWIFVSIRTGLPRSRESCACAINC